MTWSIADHGFEMTLSKEVPNLIRRHVQPWLSGWLKTHELLISDVGSWAIHPGGPRILDAVEEGLSLDENKMSASREVFAQYGNMSSPTTLFILDRLFKCNSRPPCVALAFGPGLTVEAALLNRD
jgi:predicted naringenin-chalcone synthase